MKKKILLMIGIILTFIPFKTKAANVSLSCTNTTLTPNSQTNCIISGYSENEVSALTAHLQATGNISISSISTSSIWQGNGSDGKIDLYTDNNKINSFSIGSFTITSLSSGSGTVSISNVVFTDADFSEIQISGVSVTIDIKEENVQVNNNNNNNNDSNNTAANNNNNNNNSSSDNNNLILNNETKSSDATLKSLTISDGILNFSEEKYEYEIEVSNSVEKISIEAVANDSNANIKLPDDLTLDLGENSFEIIVTAVDGTVKKYKLIINRSEHELSTDSSLKSIKIDGYKIDFNDKNYSYDIGEVKANKLNIHAIANDSKASVKIYGNENLSKNDSIVIKVTAEDGSFTEYILYVNNTLESNKTNVSLIIFVLLSIVLFGLNIFLFLKIKKMKK